MAVEQYNQANIRLGDIQGKLAETEAELAQAQADLLAGRERFNRRVAGIYKSGHTGGLLEVVLSARTFGDLLRVVSSIQTISEHDAALLKQVKEDRRRIRQASKLLAGQKNNQERLTKSLASRQKTVEKGLDRRQQVLAGVTEDIAEQEESLARLARASQPVRLASSAPSPAPVVVANPAPVAAPDGDKAAAVVSIVQAQLGKPYVWAAAGPDSFDCSGLTMYVFAQVGISLPHSAEAQFNMGTRVSKDQLQPGDLIFGAHGGYIGHVGIYIGGDQYIHSPQTGDVVKISTVSGRRNYIGAVRLF